MSHRLLRFILALYPRGFRRRYGREVQDLVTDLEASGEHSRISLVGGLLVSAVAERLHAVRPHARLTIPTLVVVAALLGASVGLHWLGSGQRFPRASVGAGTYLPPTTKPSTRPGTAQAPTGQPPPLPTDAAAGRGVPPPPPPTPYMTDNEGSNWPWQ
jgi:hypothetical protein